jgi:arabinogalactan oligomer/maltooligosaccharide transport system permease protein
MSFSRRIAQSRALGLGLAVAFTATVVAWLFHGAEAELDLQYERRLVQVDAGSLAAVLAGIERAEVGRLLVEWQARDPGHVSALVVGGMELLGSSRTEDGAPRRLRRDEKALFDLANELRAARETNISEGVVRKKLVHVDAQDGNLYVVTVPYLRDGEFAGALQLSMRPPSGGRPPDAGHAGLAMMLAVALAGFAIGALVRSPGKGILDPVHLAVLAAFLALTMTYQGLRMDSLADADRTGTQRIGAAVASAAGYHGLPASGAAAASPWDIDSYGRPLGIVRGDGTVDDPAREAAFGERVRLLWRSLLAVELVGAGLLLAHLAGYSRRVAATLSRHAYAYGYVAPAIIGMLILVFFPFLYGIVIAFTDTTLFNESLPLAERWIGWDNFVAILGDFNLYERGPDGLLWNYQNFYWTLMVTLIWTLTNVTVGVSVGFVLAMILNTEELRGRAIYRVILILPWAIPNYITALVWRGMFHPQFGVINQVLQMVGMAPIAWFDGVVSAFLTGLATNGWLSFPFMMVVILGALQSIPKDMYEAAEVEGATRWQRLRYITLPLLRPTLVPAIVLSVVWTFNMFNIIFLVSGGEPAGANEILVTKAYKIAFENYQYAYAAAYSTVIFAILLLYGVFQTRVTKATESF